MLPKVKVTVLNHPELGRTQTRADSAFNMAVNAGGFLAINYEKVGLMPAQRQVTVPWQAQLENDRDLTDQTTQYPA